MGNSLHYDDLEIDCDQGVVRRGDQSTKLTKTEVDLMAYLAARPGQLVTRTQLERDVWGFRAGVRSMAVPVAIRRLREKFGKSERAILTTVKGSGWELAIPDATDMVALRQYDSTWVPRPELERRVADALQGSRLVTLVGAGGMGKTRLAVEVIQAQGARSALVDLTAIPHDSDTEAAIRRALDCTEAELLDRVAAFEIVLLDNAEHVVEILAGILARAMPKVPDVRFVVTSRVDLRLAGERVVTIPPLTPTEAMALFESHRPIGDPEHAAKVIRAVDHVPLAVELVAHLRGDLTQVEKVVAAGRIEQARMRGRPERMSSVEGALSTSWEVLGADARRVLQLCAQWPVQIDRVGVAAMCPDIDVVGVLDRLVDSSLLERGPTGIRMLWMIRAFVRSTVGPELGMTWRAWLLDEAEALLPFRRAVWATRHRLLEMGDALWSIVKDPDGEPEQRGRAAMVLGDMEGPFSVELVLEAVAGERHAMSDRVNQTLHVLHLRDQYRRGTLTAAAVECAPSDALEPRFRAVLPEIQAGVQWLAGDRERALEVGRLGLAIMSPEEPDAFRLEGHVMVLEAALGKTRPANLVERLETLKARADSRGWHATSFELTDVLLNILSGSGQDAAAHALAKTRIANLEQHPVAAVHHNYALHTAALTLWPTDPAFGAERLQRARAEGRRNGRRADPTSSAIEALGHALALDFEAFRDAVEASKTDRAPPVLERLCGAFSLAIAVATQGEDEGRLHALIPTELGEGVGQNGAERDGSMVIERLVHWSAIQRGGPVQPLTEGRRCTIVRGIDRSIALLAEA